MGAVLKLPATPRTKPHVYLLCLLLHRTLRVQSLELVHSIQHSKLRRLPNRHLRCTPHRSSEEYCYSNEQHARRSERPKPYVDGLHHPKRFARHRNTCICGAEAVVKVSSAIRGCMCVSQVLLTRLSPRQLWSLCACQTRECRALCCWDTPTALGQALRTRSPTRTYCRKYSYHLRD
jgi:hypothetical protein